MATLTALKFDDPDKAAEALEVLRRLQTSHVVSVHDAATVTWPENARAPKVRQAVNTAGAGALGGTFWRWPAWLVVLLCALTASVVQVAPLGVPG